MTEGPPIDVFFQPANHPYFVKDKSFWTIDRVAARNRAEAPSLTSATCSAREAAGSENIAASLHSLPAVFPQNTTDQLGIAGPIFSTAKAEQDGTSGSCHSPRQAPSWQHVGSEPRLAGGKSVAGSPAFLTESIKRKKKRTASNKDCATIESEAVHPQSRRDWSSRPHVTCSYFNAGYEDSNERHSVDYGAESKWAVECAREASEGGDVEDEYRGSPSPHADTWSASGSSCHDDDIQPVALVLHVVDDTEESHGRDGSGSGLSSLTKRWFLRQKPDNGEACMATRYHRDSDHSISSNKPAVRDEQGDRGDQSAVLLSKPSFRRKGGRSRSPVVKPRLRSRSPGSLSCSSSWLLPDGRTSKHGNPSYGSVDSFGHWDPSSLPFPNQESSFFDIVMIKSDEASCRMSTSGAVSSAVPRSSIVLHHLEQFEIDENDADAAQAYSRKRRRHLKRCRLLLTAAVLGLVSMAIVVSILLVHGSKVLSLSPTPSGATTSSDELQAFSTVVGAPTTTITVDKLPKTKHVRFIGTIFIKMDFTSDMADLRSPTARNLSKQFCDTVSHIYSRSDSSSLVYNSCNVTQLENGSVKVKFKTEFIEQTTVEDESENETKAELDIIDVLKHHITENRFGNFICNTEYFLMAKERGDDSLPMPAFSNFEIHQSAVITQPVNELGLTRPGFLGQSVTTQTSAYAGGFIFPSHPMSMVHLTANLDPMSTHTLPSTQTELLFESRTSSSDDGRQQVVSATAAAGKEDAMNESVSIVDVLRMSSHSAVTINGEGVSISAAVSSHSLSTVSLAFGSTSGGPLDNNSGDKSSSVPIGILPKANNPTNNGYTLTGLDSLHEGVHTTPRLPHDANAVSTVMVSVSQSDAGYAGEMTGSDATVPNVAVSIQAGTTSTDPDLQTSIDLKQIMASATVHTINSSTTPDSSVYAADEQQEDRLSSSGILLTTTAAGKDQSLHTSGTAAPKYESGLHPSTAFAEEHQESEGTTSSAASAVDTSGLSTARGASSTGSARLEATRPELMSTSGPHTLASSVTPVLDQESAVDSSNNIIFTTTTLTNYAHNNRIDVVRSKAVTDSIAAGATSTSVVELKFSSRIFDDKSSLSTAAFESGQGVLTASEATTYSQPGEWKENVETHSQDEGSSNTVAASLASRSFIQVTGSTATAQGTTFTKYRLENDPVTTLASSVSAAGSQSLERDFSAALATTDVTEKFPLQDTTLTSADGLRSVTYTPLDVNTMSSSLWMSTTGALSSVPPLPTSAVGVSSKSAITFVLPSRVSTTKQDTFRPTDKLDSLLSASGRRETSTSTTSLQPSSLEVSTLPLTTRPETAPSHFLPLIQTLAPSTGAKHAPTLQPIISIPSSALSALTARKTTTSAPLILSSSSLRTSPDRQDARSPPTSLFLSSLTTSVLEGPGSASLPFENTTTKPITIRSSTILTTPLYTSSTSKLTEAGLLSALTHATTLASATTPSETLVTASSVSTNIHTLKPLADRTASSLATVAAQVILMASSSMASQTSSAALATSMAGTASPCMPGENTNVADPNDCQAYYICFSTLSIHKKCDSADTYFNEGGCEECDASKCSRCASAIISMQHTLSASTASPTTIRQVRNREVERVPPLDIAAVSQWEAPTVRHAVEGGGLPDLQLHRSTTGPRSGASTARVSMPGVQLLEQLRASASLSTPVFVTKGMTTGSNLHRQKDSSVTTDGSQADKTRASIAAMLDTLAGPQTNPNASLTSHSPLQGGVTLPYPVQTLAMSQTLKSTTTATATLAVESRQLDMTLTREYQMVRETLSSMAAVTHQWHTVRADPQATTSLQGNGSSKRSSAGKGACAGKTNGTYADPNNCAGLLYCFTNGTPVFYNCTECNHMYNVTLGMCTACNQFICNRCKPC